MIVPLVAEASVGDGGRRQSAHYSLPIEPANRDLKITVMVLQNMVYGLKCDSDGNLSRRRQKAVGAALFPTRAINSGSKGVTSNGNDVTVT
jgi:hypothetical protein